MHLISYFSTIDELTTVKMIFSCSQEAVDFVRKGLAQGKSCSDVSCDILDFCIATDPKESRGIGCDNMTCCIVRFKDEFYLKHSGSNL